MAQNSHMKDLRCWCTLCCYCVSCSQVHATDAKENSGGVAPLWPPGWELHCTGVQSSRGHNIQRIQMCSCFVISYRTHTVRHKRDQDEKGGSLVCSNIKTVITINFTNVSGLSSRCSEFRRISWLGYIKMACPFKSLIEFIQAWGIA